MLITVGNIGNAISYVKEISTTKCGIAAEKGDLSCSKCAANLVIKCPSCRHDVPLFAIYCLNCWVNFAVAKLIEETKQKKSAVNFSYTEKEQQVRAELENFYKTIRGRINQKS